VRIWIKSQGESFPCSPACNAATPLYLFADNLLLFLTTHCWTFTVDINILVIFAWTGETGNKGKGREKIGVGHGILEIEYIHVMSLYYANYTIRNKTIKS
jgi:hypothetical protein